MTLEHLRVLELGDDPAVSFCSLQLARWGAQVAVGASFLGDLPNRSPEHEGVSLLWQYLSANKTIVEEGLAELAMSADVIVTNCDRDALIECGIEPGPTTIFHRLTPFSFDGILQEMEGFPILFEAASGFLVSNGEPGQEPARMPGNIVSYVVGAHACVATLAAVHKRINTGEIESIETCQLDALTTTVPFVRSQYLERAEERYGGPTTGVRLYPIGDGAISGNLLDPETFSLVLAELGIREEEVPESLNSPTQRRDQTKLSSFLAERSKQAVSEQVFQGVMKRGAPRFGLFQSPRDLLNNRQVASLDSLKSIADKSLGTLTYPGLPASISAVERPDLQLSRSTRKHQWVGERLPVRTWLKGRRPLDGVRIVDFTQAWIGPFATMMLADLGADVIKVESHKRVDVWRNWRGSLPEGCVRNEDAHELNISPNFNSTNRNKREIAIDLNQRDGVTVAKDLIASADVVMSNFTPRVMRKFGLDFESVREVKPDIVYVCWSGYGEVGPYRDYKANGATIEAMAGWDALFGYHDGDPIVMGFYQTDAFTGLQMAACTLLAVMNRDLTGKSQNVRGSMLESAIGYIGEEIISAGLGQPLKRWGNRHPDFVPHGVFHTNEADRWVAIVCRSDEEWHRMKSVIGCDSREFDSSVERLNRVDEVEGLVTAWTQMRSRWEAAANLRAAGLSAVAVVDSLEVIDHPEFTSRNWFKQQSHADVRDIWHSGFAWRFSASKLSADLPSPRLGEHSEEILASLGYSADRIEELFSDDTIGCVLGHSSAAARH